MKNEPRWVWDVWGTGYPCPEEPAWFQEYLNSIVKASIYQPKANLCESQYDELKQYLDDLDRHRGKAVTQEPRYIAFHGPFGITTILRGSDE